MKKAIGIDLGGTVIKGGVIDENGEILQEKQILTQAFQGKEKVIGRLKQLIEDLRLTGEKLAGIGIGSPGPIDLKRGIIFNPPNLPSWNEVPLAKILEKHFKLPIVLNNDANVALLGEAWMGAGKSKKNILMLTLGTGIGGAAILDGRLYTGSSGFAAEFGHMILDFEGPLCGCGQRGCLESLASATFLERKAQEKNLKISDARDVFEQARKGNKVAQDIIDEMTFWLSLGIGNLINIFNPEMIIIGGGLIKSWDFFGEKISQKAKKKALQSLADHVKIVPAKLKDWAGILGAARQVFKK